MTDLKTITAAEVEKFVAERVMGWELIRWRHGASQWVSDEQDTNWFYEMTETDVGWIWRPLTDANAETKLREVVDAIPYMKQRRICNLVWSLWNSRMLHPPPKKPSLIGITKAKTGDWAVACWVEENGGDVVEVSMILGREE